MNPAPHAPNPDAEPYGGPDHAQVLTDAWEAVYGPLTPTREDA